MVAAIAVPDIDGVEFDVRFSADGEPILLHDETLERVQGVAGAAASLSAAELARYGVPSLADVLSVMPADAFLDIELKEAPNERFASVLRAGRGGRPDRAVVSSFEVDALTATRALLPGWPRWLNAIRLDRETLDAGARLDCGGVAIEHRILGAAGIARARAVGLEVAAWTLTSGADERRVAELGVDVAIVEGEAIGREGRRAG
jgi:glycerophosphoryl diester phosphodiesterase